MKFTYGWLREHLACTLDAATLGERLTMAGLELDALEDLGGRLERVQVGVLEEVAPHPGADRLTVCTVRVGEEKLTVVCGATNHRQGDKVAVAREGAELAGGLVIRPSAIRGVASQGMLCSLKELGLAETAEGILILPESARCGAPLAQVLGRDDVLFDVATTPNRGDCLSVRGIAREMAAVLGLPLLPLAADRVVVDDRIAAPAVDVSDSQGCPRYSGRVVRGVRIGPSPDWLRQRLESVGLRAINNVVDATNYVMLELGQPLHAFDLARLHLPLVVRRGGDGESMTTLDGEVRTLTPDMTVIADQRGPLALAGIMGGEESGVTDQTTDLLLESACFEPIRVARTGRRLGILSESRYRFERGVDPQGVVPALDRLTGLIIALAGGRAGAVALVATDQGLTAPPILFRHERAIRLTGIQLSPQESAGYLTSLGCCQVGVPDDQGVTYQPPSWRHDLRREEDLMEEVVRLYGYDRVPSRLPEGALQPVAVSAGDTTARRVRRLLVGLGYLENINYAFVSRELVHRFTPALQPLALLNPLSEEQGVLRTALTPGLVESARRNLSRGNQQLRFFEVGRVFLPEPDLAIHEEERLAGLVCGTGERAWHSARRGLDFFDLKGDLESLLAGLQVRVAGFTAGGPEFLHPGRCARLFLEAPVGDGGVEVGWVGQLHPVVQEALEIPLPLFLFEVGLAALGRSATAAVTGKLSRFPAMERDFAFVVPVTVTAGAVLAATKAVDPVLIREVRLFDLYELAAGMKSLAVTILVQADDRTLTEPEIQDLSNRIIQRMAEEFGASLRGPSC